MPYKTSGYLVIFEDAMTELEVCRAETYKTADNIAAALNDAVRWRKLRSMLGYVQDGSETSLRITLDDATRDYVITDLGTKKWWFGRSLETAIDSAPNPT